MDLRKFIKVFSWTEQDRSRVVLGPNTRINPETNRAQLGTYDSEEYPTDSDLYVKSWVSYPQAMRQWLGFEATVVHKKNLDGEQVTSVGFRLSAGTAQYYWNGTAWVASAGNWNTEEEIAAHISAFPATERKLQVIANLKTTDADYTPELIDVKVLFSALIDSEIEDLVERSLLPSLRASVRPITQVALTKIGTDNQVEFSGYPIDAGYRFVGVDAVFNHTDDPGHDADLYESHTTRVDLDNPWVNGTVDAITLNALVTAGKMLWIRLKYEPVVALSTNRDWRELAHVPAVVIESVTYAAQKLSGEDYVGNKSDGSAVVIPAPLQGRLSITMLGVSGTLVDHERMAAEVTRFFGSHDPVVSTGLDETYRLWLVDEHEQQGGADSDELYAWRKTARIEGFRMWDQGATNGYLVQRFRVTGAVEVTVE